MAPSAHRRDGGWVEAHDELCVWSGSPTRRGAEPKDRPAAAPAGSSLSPPIPRWSRPSSAEGQPAHVTRSARRPESTGSRARTCGVSTELAPPSRPLRVGRRRERMEEARGRRRNRPRAGSARRAGRPDRSALRGTKAPRGACDGPSRGSGSFRLMAKRPSDRRSPGRNPGPQGAFEVSMINVSCNSH